MMIKDNYLNKYFIVSPIGLSLIAYIVFLIATFFPKDIYEYYLSEPDLMYLDVYSNLFYLLVLLSFICGVLCFKKNDLPAVVVSVRLLSSMTLMLAPLLLAIILNSVSLLIFLKNNPGMLTGWINDAASVKDDFDSTGGFSEALAVLFCVCWWSARNLMLHECLFNKKNNLLRLLLLFGFLLAGLTSLMKASRADLIPGFFGMLLLLSFYKNKLNINNNASILIDFAKIMLGAFFLFITLSFLRGMVNSYDMISNFMGYTIASYNRMTAVIKGELIYPMGGTGIYAFRFLGHIPLLESVFHITDLLNMPTTETAWKSEFTAVGATRLQQGYIWASALGYVFADIGWWIIVYFFCYGLVMMKLWRGFLKGDAFSVCLYPWFAYSVLFWLGDNFVAMTKLVTFLGVGILLYFYEKYLLSFDNN